MWKGISLPSMGRELVISDAEEGKKTLLSLP